MAPLNIRIQLRNDTAENWTTKNPLLLKGEMGVEIDTKKIKEKLGIQPSKHFATLIPSLSTGQDSYCWTH